MTILLRIGKCPYFIIVHMYDKIGASGSSLTFTVTIRVVSTYVHTQSHSITPTLSVRRKDVPGRPKYIAPGLKKQTALWKVKPLSRATNLRMGVNAANKANY